MPEQQPPQPFDPQQQSPFAVDPAVRDHMLASIWQTYVQTQVELQNVRAELEALKSGQANGKTTVVARPEDVVADHVARGK